MSKKYLDLNGLAYFWGKIKAYVAAHGGGGDMYKSTYDTNNSGVVDNAEALGGVSASGYALKDGLFKIVELQISNSSQIAAHGYQGGTTYTVPAASRPSGMILAGIVGYAASNYRLVPSSHYVSGDHSIFANIANTSATSVSAGATITFRLLYVKATSA